MSKFVVNRVEKSLDRTWAIDMPDMLKFTKYMLDIR